VWRLRIVVGYDQAADEALAAFLTEARTSTTITSTDTLNALLDRWLEQVAPLRHFTVTRPRPGPAPSHRYGNSPPATKRWPRPAVASWSTRSAAGFEP
jgi:hypothetical protein